MPELNYHHNRVTQLTFTNQGLPHLEITRLSEVAFAVVYEKKKYWFYTLQCAVGDGKIAGQLFSWFHFTTERV